MKNVCIECNAESFLFEKKNDCVLATVILNCNSYNEFDECIECVDGY